MKTTLDLPDDLVRAVKIRAVEENQKLKDMVAELLRRGLAEESRVTPPSRVRFPIVECQRARPEEEMTPERLAAVLLEDEARWYGGADAEPLR